MEFLQLFGAFLLGILARLLYDVVGSPRLEVIGVGEAFIIVSPEPPDGSQPLAAYQYLGYRAKLENKQKGFLDVAAENCVAWLEMEGAPEAYQLSWVGGHDAVTINVGDYREVELCARNQGNGSLVAPNQQGYFSPRPRELGDGASELKGILRITARNGRKATTSLVIRPDDDGKRLAIELRPEEV